MQTLKNRAVIILGMRAGGGAAVSGALRLLGAHAGSGLAGMQAISESADDPGIAELEERLLAAMGSAWDEILLRPDDWLRRPAVTEFQEKLGDILASNFKAAPVWEIMDTRACRLLPAWTPVLSALGCDPIYVCVVRHPLEVASALAQEDQLSKVKALMLWLDHHLPAEEDSRNQKRVIVHYQSFLDDWRAALQPVMGYLGGAWLNAGEKAAAEIGSLIDHAGKDYRGDGDYISPLVKRTYEALIAGARGEEAAMRAALDLAGNEWRQEARFFGPEINASALRRRVAELEAAYESQVKVSRSFLEKLHATESNLRAKKAEFNDLKKRRDEMKRKVREMESSMGWKLTKPLRKIFGKGVTPISDKKAKSSIETLPEPPKVNPKVLAFARVESPAVSVIIPVYNQLRHTLSCLQSLQLIEKEVATEVVVMDDGSADETEETLKVIPGLCYGRNAANAGFVETCNRGAEKARGEYLLFLNNDTRVSSGALRAMLETFKRNPAAGLVGAKLVYPNGVLQEAGGAVYNDASAANLGNGTDPGHPDYTYLREVDYCSGAGIMIPRRLFFDLGGFDRRYSPCYYEDADLAFKVREAGYKVYYQPAAEIGHYEGISCGRDMASGPKQNQERNRLVFFERWAAKLAGQPAPGGDAVPRRGGKRILVVEHHLPQPDRNAGTMRMDRLLRMMAEAGHRVTLMPDDLEGVGGYTESLEQAGVRVPRKPYVNNVETWLRENAARHDIVVLSRLGIARKYLQTIRAAAPAAKIIYDTVDLHFMREQGEAELRDDDALRERARQTKAEEIFLIEAADCTWVVSAAERETLRREAPSAKVEVVTLPYELHGSATPFAERRDLLFIGGFSHAPNIDAVRFFMTEIWPLIEGRAPGVKLYIIGADPPEEVRAFGAENVIVTGFVPEVRGYFDRVRLSVAPLRFGAGVKGKINQSMSHGVPVVATTVAIEGMQLRPNEEVLVADESADFAARVAEVYNQEALWSRVSESGLRATQRLYSVEAVRERLLGSL